MTFIIYRPGFQPMLYYSACVILGKLLNSVLWFHL
jgi:hypothetical protein